MKKLFFFLLILHSAFTAIAQNTQSKVSAVLFKNVKTAASIAEQNKISKELGLTLAADRSFMMSEFPVSVQVYPTDLNKDGMEELFIVMSSTALYGMTGTGFEWYAQNKSGVFTRRSDVSGQGIPTFFATANLGYPDLMIGGPGFEFPVYRWNGKSYAYSRRIKDADLAKKKTLELDSLTATYIRSRK